MVFVELKWVEAEYILVIALPFYQLDRLSVSTGMLTRRDQTRHHYSTGLKAEGESLATAPYISLCVENSEEVTRHVNTAR
jgi:hypothetical protein